MSQTPNSIITVGVDGSPGSMVAAEWAAQEALLRHHDLVLVHGYVEGTHGYVESAAAYQPDIAWPAIDAVDSSHLSRELLSRTAEQLRARHQGLRIQEESVHSEPRKALRAASSRSALTVVGTRGRGRVAGVLLGSVALYVASLGCSPVAVVPALTEPATGPVLLGADGTAASEAAVGYAFDEAAVRGTGLVAAAVWDDVAMRTFAISAPLVGQLEDQEEDLVLAEQLAGWSSKYPDVPVSRVILRGRPAAQLLDYRADGQLPQVMVVGSRGHGGVTGLALGSTSQRLISAARVPVIVVRRQPER